MYRGPDSYPRRIAVVGSREYPLPEAVRAFVTRCHQKYPEAILVSGGTRGVDQTAEHQAMVVGMRTLILKANWDLYGRKAGFLRNSEIVQNADVVAAFWDGRSHDTKDTIEKAKATRLPVFVYGPRGKLLPN